MQSRNLSSTPPLSTLSLDVYPTSKILSECAARPRSRRGSSHNPGVAELADAHDSKSCGRKAVMVRPHSPGPKVHIHRRRLFFTPTGTCALPPLKFKISSVSLNYALLS